MRRKLTVCAFVPSSQEDSPAVVMPRAGFGELLGSWWLGVSWDGCLGEAGGSGTKVLASIPRRQWLFRVLEM